MVRDKQDDRVDVVTLPLTQQELLVVMTCLDIACESERIDATDKQTAGIIRRKYCQGHPWKF
jgi:hypothetical protein